MVRKMERKGLARRTPLRSKTPLKRSTKRIKTKKPLKTGRGFYGKNDKGKCDRVFSLIIRSYGRCENCGKQPPNVKLECAHINDRWYSATRVMFDNAFCLCSGCHRTFTRKPLVFAKFVEEMLGQEKADQLILLAQPVTKMDWSAELERLCRLANEFGIECKDCK